MGGVAAVAVLATIVAAVLLFGDGGSGGPKGGSDNGQGQETAAVASAKDTGPVAVITDDPSCTAWASINNELANSGQGLWNDRDRSVPASAWNPKQRAQFIAAGQSMRSAAAQTVGLVKLTPHRVMRELYQQFIAYARAYSERIPKYTPADNNLAGAANSASSALGSICASISDGPAAARGPLVTPSARHPRSLRWATWRAPSRSSRQTTMSARNGSRRWIISVSRPLNGSNWIPMSRRSIGTKSRRRSTTRLDR